MDSVALKMTLGLRQWKAVAGLLEGEAEKVPVFTPYGFPASAAWH